MQIVGGFRDLWRGGVAAGGGLSGPAAWISANRTTGVSPAGVFFEAVVTGFAVDRPAHDLRFRWTFGDPGVYAAIAADHPHGTSRDTAYGPMAAHCFASPGTYTVSLEVTDGAQTATASCEIEVTDPDSVFSGVATYAISGTGNFSGAAPGAVQVSDLAAAVAHAQGAGQRFARFQFRRGATHSVASAVPGASFDALHFSGYGGGAAPVLNGGVTLAGGAVSGSVSMEGLSLRGGFDPKTGGSVSANGVDVAGAGSISLSGMDIAGFAKGLRWADGQANAIVSDCRIADWAETGLEHPGADRSAVVGSTIRMDVDTLPEAVSDGPGRLGGDLARYVLWHCDLYSAGGATEHAPCWRWNVGGVAGASGVIGFSRFEGGAPVLSLAPASPVTEAGPGELIVEKSYLLGSAASAPAGVASIGFGGISFRSSVLVMPDVAPEQGTDSPAFLTGGGALSSAANDAAPVSIHSNTFVDLRSPATLVNGAQAFAVEEASEFAHWGALSIENNLTHGPDLAAPVTVHAPVDETAFYAPLYRGLRDAGGLDPSYATPAASGALFAPLPGPGGLPSAGAGSVSLDDFFGEFRAPSAEVGAIEYVSSFAINVLGAGTFEVAGAVSGTVELTVDAPSIHAGTYDVDLALLEDAPLFLTDPSASGTIAAGQTLTAVSGLVAFLATDGEPVTSWSWRRGPIEVGTGPTYVVQAADETSGLSLVQELINSAPSTATGTGSVIAASVPVVSATTGSPTTWSDASHDYYLFENSGSITFSQSGVLAAELTGGGAGGGGGNYSRGGGGGAGAVVLDTDVAISAMEYAISVGAGGAGGIAKATAATKGGQTSAFALTAAGGGIGQTDFSIPSDGTQMDGGCGGGGWGSGSQTGGEGDPGYVGGTGAGNSPGGGGGMGGPGGNGVLNANAGAPGAAIQSTLDGTWLAEGGEGGRYNLPGGTSHGGGIGGNSANGGNGAGGTGSGGGGAGGGPNRNGGGGGSGRVLIRVPKSA